jgi:hypothetical protein
MAKRQARKRAIPPFETDELRKSLSKFFDLPYTDDVTGVTSSIGSFKWGVYIFYDYDGEPIYVGQTKERVRDRIGRHLTNQRTDAVAMSVLDPFEVCEIEVYPLPQFEDVKSKLDGKKNPAYQGAKDHLDALESLVHARANKEAKFGILNEKDPPKPKVKIDIPKPLRARIVSEEVFKLRSHADVRIARRAHIVSRLALTISERLVQNGLRRTLITQARRMESLAGNRFTECGGQSTVEEGPESADEEREE